MKNVKLVGFFCSIIFLVVLIAFFITGTGPFGYYGKIVGAFDRNSEGFMIMHPENKDDGKVIFVLPKDIIFVTAQDNLDGTYVKGKVSLWALIKYHFFLDNVIIYVRTPELKADWEEKLRQVRNLEYSRYDVKIDLR